MKKFGKECSKMFVVSADTYFESYGCKYHLFYVGKSKDECLDFIKSYNKLADEFEEFCAEKNLKETQSAENFSDLDKKVFKNFEQKLVFDHYSFEVFKFENKDFEIYIDGFENGKPLYIGGYTE